MAPPPDEPVSGATFGAVTETLSIAATVAVSETAGIVLGAAALAGNLVMSVIDSEEQAGSYERGPEVYPSGRKEEVNHVSFIVEESGEGTIVRHSWIEGGVDNGWKLTFEDSLDDVSKL